jgi:hypothetical protein
MPKQDAKPPLPEQRIKELGTPLREAHEKAALFKAVLDVMRKDYGIPVKKPSGRSSRKSGSKSWALSAPADVWALKIGESRHCDRAKCLSATAVSRDTALPLLPLR